MSGLSFNPTARYMDDMLQKMKNGTDIRQVEKLDGIKMLDGVPTARIAEHRERMVIRPDDVFIVTYPKCGTTWMQHIVKLIVCNGVDNGIADDMFIAWHEHMTLEEIESMHSPRYVKSHLPYQLMPGGGDPVNTKAKYINLMRNPKDTAVSFYSHLKTMLPANAVPPWEVYFENYLTDEIPYGSFYSHFLGWWAHKDAPNILILTYEQIKRNPRNAITTVADFLGCNLSSEVIDKIVVDTSFDKMKDNKAANKSATFDKMPGKGSFMNKGIIGNWKSVLTAEESARIDAIVADKLGGSGLVFDYGDD